MRQGGRDQVPCDHDIQVIDRRSSDDDVEDCDDCAPDDEFDAGCSVHDDNADTLPDDVVDVCSDA
jgi:hypothetical protein